MNRKANSIFTVDEKKMTKDERANLLSHILDSRIEADSITPDLYVPEDMQDAFLFLMKSEKATCKRNFPKRFIEAEDGTLADDGKKYRLATEKDINSELLSKQPEFTYEGLYEFLNAMTVAELKVWIKENPKLDKVVNLKYKKETIIQSVLEFYKLKKSEVVENVKKSETSK